MLECIKAVKPILPAPLLSSPGDTPPAERPAQRPLGRTGLNFPAIIFGTSCLGNLYEVVPDDRKLAIVGEIVRHSPSPAIFDSAGKYGAGLSLESMGRALRRLGVASEDVVISNKLAWYRVPLRGPEPTFERGVWAGIAHDAEARISYEGILQCYEQGCQLLGKEYPPQVVSVHDPDEYLAAAKTPAERAQRFAGVMGAYQALFELRKQGVVKAVGIGSKDWRVIREVSEHVDLDWVMFACSLTVYTHQPELVQFIAHLRSRGVGMVNSAVFNAGFLIGGQWFDYRKPDPVKDAGLFEWRGRFLAICQRFDVKPADVCVQFGLAVPGIISIALNTGHPERIKANINSAQTPIPSALWRALKDAGLLDREFPYLG